MKIWQSPAGALKLERYPFSGSRSHQAWDAADEWILRRFPAQSGSVLITGEAFGVLATAWGRTEVTALSDSLLSLSALERNRGLNPEYTGGGLITASSADPNPEAASSVEKIFIRLPKSIELLEIYIRLSLKYASAETEIWLGGMDKRWSRGVKKITDRYLTAAGVFPFERHARWISFQKAEVPPEQLRESADGRIWRLEKYPVRITPAPAVFSSSALDPGTAAFLGCFPEEEAALADTVADIGCGSGILGLCAAHLNTDAKILFTDESFLAVQAAEANAGLNGCRGRSSFIPSNGLTGVDDGSVDLVLCNPPFHYQNIQTIERLNSCSKRPAGC